MYRVDESLLEKMTHLNQLTLSEQYGERKEFYDLSHFNNLTSLSRSIIKLSNLDYLNISNNNFKSIPNEIFKLKNMDRFLFHNNPNLNIKIINFVNKVNGVQFCDFTNVTITCYQRNTCHTVQGVEVSSLTGCTDEEIQDILDSLNSNYTIIFIIFGAVSAFVLITTVVAVLFLIKHRKSRQQKLNLTMRRYTASSNTSNRFLNPNASSKSLNSRYY